jgi:hypothetical protein
MSMQPKFGPEGLVKEVFLLNVTVSVKGRTVKKERTGDRRIGETQERDFEVEERVENVKQYAAARKLETAVRGLADRFGTYLDGYGYLASADAKDRFVREFENLMATDVADHNNELGQTATVTAKAVTLAIGQVFGPGDVSVVLAHVGEELTKARAWLVEGNTEPITNWLKRAQRLPALVPALNGNVVASAIEAIREAKNTVAKRVRDGFADPAAYKATLGKPLEGDKLKDALACVEVDAAIEAVDSALGWLEPTREQQGSTAVAV